jgi:hypothetical protein
VARGPTLSRVSRSSMSRSLRALRWYAVGVTPASVEPGRAVSLAPMATPVHRMRPGSAFGRPPRSKPRTRTDPRKTYSGDRVSQLKPNRRVGGIVNETPSAHRHFLLAAPDLYLAYLMSWRSERPPVQRHSAYALGPGATGLERYRTTHRTTSGAPHAAPPIGISGAPRSALGAAQRARCCPREILGTSSHTHGLRHETEP